MARLLLFATARDAAGGCSSIDVDAASVGGVLLEARGRFGAPFEAVLQTARIWIDGQPIATSTLDQPVDTATEIAVVPPISGG